MFTYQIYIFIWSEFFLQVLERQAVAVRPTVQGVHHLLHYDSWDKLQHAMTLGMFGWMNKRTIKPKNGFLGLTKWHIDNFSRLALLPHRLLAYHTAVRLFVQHKKGLSHELLARTILPFLALKAATGDVEGSEMRRHMATIMSQTPTDSVAETCRTPTIIGHKLIITASPTANYKHTTRLLKVQQINVRAALTVENWKHEKK